MSDKTRERVKSSILAVGFIGALHAVFSFCNIAAGMVSGHFRSNLGPWPTYIALGFAAAALIRIWAPVVRFRISELWGARHKTPEVIEEVLQADFPENNLTPGMKGAGLIWLSAWALSMLMIPPVAIVIGAISWVLSKNALQPTRAHKVALHMGRAAVIAGSVLTALIAALYIFAKEG